MSASALLRCSNCSSSSASSVSYWCCSRRRSQPSKVGPTSPAPHTRSKACSTPRARTQRQTILTPGFFQVGKLIKLDNMHLRTFANGLGTGDTFPTRPAIPGGSPEYAKIGDTSPPDSLRYFHYPATVIEAQRQYQFVKMIQFSPRGECRPQNDNYEMRAVIEVGLQQTHGTSAPALADPKNCAVQLTGFSGNVKIYQM